MSASGNDQDQAKKRMGMSPASYRGLPVGDVPIWGFCFHMVLRFVDKLTNPAGTIKKVFDESDSLFDLQSTRRRGATENFA
jgi:hypothetical protein